MINLSIHGVTSVELAEPTAFESQGVAHWSADILVHRGNECQALRLFTRDGPDALRENDDALDAKQWMQFAQGKANTAKRWHNVALDQTRRADDLQQELDDLRADLAGLSRRMAE